MIFVAVGTQLPFPRLVNAVDAWAGQHDRSIRIFGQIGPTEHRPLHFDSESFISPARFEQCIERASLVVAHAGIGTIVSALLKRKPIVVMPRLAELGEQRNNHQPATARRFAERGLVEAVFTEAHLVSALEHHTRCAQKALPIGEFASAQLITTIRQFIEPASLVPRQTTPNGSHPKQTAESTG